MGGRNESSNRNQKFTTIILVLISVVLLTGMGRHIRKDRSEDPFYSWIIGKQYSTQQDLVVLKLSRWSKKIYLSEFENDTPSREEIGEKFPYKEKKYRNIILGILPAGSVFKVNRVEEEGHSSATFIYYYADILSSDNEGFVGKEISPSFLTELGDPPRFDEKFIKEIRLN